MRPETAKIGQVWRKLFSTWKLEADEMLDLSFSLGPSFECGGSMKIGRGDKYSLQTTYKAGGQIGAKFGTPGTEFTAGLSSEISETILHEFSASHEWSYQSRPCEYCAPRIHFPEARVRILSKWMFHVPAWASRRTVFVPGVKTEIRSHCRHAPDRCEGCEQEGKGSNSVVTYLAASTPTLLERVLLFDRRKGEEATVAPPPEDGLSGRVLLKELLTMPDDNTVPGQLHVVELAKTFLISDAQYILYPVDDLDRALGSLRLYPGKNRIFLLSKVIPRRGIRVDVIVEDTGELFEAGKVLGEVERNGYSLIELELDIPDNKKEDNLLLMVSKKEEPRRPEQTWPEQTWPVVLVTRIPR